MKRFTLPEIGVFGVSGCVVFLLLGLAVLPLGAIWSVNLLFGLSIPWTLKTWFAALILIMCVHGSSSSSSSK